MGYARLFQRIRGDIATGGHETPGGWRLDDLWRRSAEHLEPSSAPQDGSRLFIYIVDAASAQCHTRRWTPQEARALWEMHTLHERESIPATTADEDLASQLSWLTKNRCKVAARFLRESFSNPERSDLQDEAMTASALYLCSTRTGSSVVAEQGCLEGHMVLIRYETPRGAILRPFTLPSERHEREQQMGAFELMSRVSRVISQDSNPANLGSAATNLREAGGAKIHASFR